MFGIFKRKSTETEKETEYTFTPYQYKRVELYRPTVHIDMDGSGRSIFYPSGKTMYGTYTDAMGVALETLEKIHQSITTDNETILLSNQTKFGIVFDTGLFRQATTQVESDTFVYTENPDDATAVVEELWRVRSRYQQILPDEHRELFTKELLDTYPTSVISVRDENEID